MKRTLLILAALVASLFISSSCKGMYQYTYSAGCISAHSTGTPAAVSSDLGYLDSFFTNFDDGVTRMSNDPSSFDEEMISKFNGIIMRIESENRAIKSGTYVYGVTRLSAKDGSSTVIVQHTFGD